MKRGEVMGSDSERMGRRYAGGGRKRVVMFATVRSASMKRDE